MDTSKIRMAHYSYVLNCKENTTIAFVVKVKGVNKVKSGIVSYNDIDNKELIVNTLYKTYIVKYSNVVWVKEGDIWPNGVYKLLKGGKRK